LALGDYNADGNLDVAVSRVDGAFADRFSVALGNGTGSFPTVNDISAPMTAWSIATGDWNSDGKLDLILPGRFAQVVTLYLGAGDGSFVQALTLHTGASPFGAFPFWVAGADFNEDGFQDIVVSNLSGGTLMVYLQTPPSTLPTIACPSNITVNNDPNLCSAVVNFTVTATGSPAPTVVCTPPSGTAFPVGITTVNCTATNGAGSASCSFTVTVKDNEKPTITCPADITVLTPGPGQPTAVTFAAPTVADNCPGASAVQSAGLASGSTFPIGRTTVTYTATDASSNSSSCSFVVTVPACVTTVTVEGNFVTKASTTTAKKVAIQGAKVILLPKSAVQSSCNLLDASCMWANLATINTAGDPQVLTGSDGKATVYSTVSDPNGYAIYLDLTDATGVDAGAPAITTGTLKIAVANTDCALQKQFTVILVGGSTTTAAMTSRQQKITGSELDITYPDSVIWDGTQFAYPFIFWSDSDWEVDVCASVPQGYRILNNPCLQFFLANQTKVIFFDVVDVGSPEPRLQVRGRVRHNGRLTPVDFDIPGFRRGRGVHARPENATTLSAQFLPGSYELYEAYPDPFNPSTQIQFDLPEYSRVKLAIYDILGRELKVLVDGDLGAGRYREVWESRDRTGRIVSSGVYFYRMDAVSLASDKKIISLKKMLLLK